jgi:hypothetical protein
MVISGLFNLCQIYKIKVILIKCVKIKHGDIKKSAPGEGQIPYITL